MRKLLLGMALVACFLGFGQSNGQRVNSLKNQQTERSTKATKPTTFGKTNITPTVVNSSSLTPKQQFILATKGISTDANNGDPRNLPLSKNGKLLSVDGFEVDFRVPTDPNISNICFTPRPYVNGQQKDASCSYSVPCDIASNRDAASTSTKYFQLVWHVMTSGGPSSNIDQTRIDNLMTELNADFASHNMIFCTTPANFYEDAANYNHDINTEEFSLKDTYNVTPTQVINIYVVGSMTAGGYARFPYDPNGGTDEHGGIVLNRGNCNLGTHTLAHEMGHVFGLEHTFSGVDERGECSSCYEKVRNVNGSPNTSGVATPLGGPYTDEGDREGDWCSDTNPHDTYAYNCGTSSNSNGPCDSNPWANAPVDNHMSYSFCSSQFTDQQSRRMHCMVGTYLSSWTSYAGGVCGTLPPVADFVGTPLYGVAPLTVTFTDASSPSSIITGWNWNFDNLGVGGVAPATAATQGSHTVTYSNPGVYEVSLTVTSANGNDTETKTAYVEVISPPNTCDTLDTQWNTPAPTLAAYTFGPNDYVVGVPSPTLLTNPTDLASFSERYPSAGPGTTVGGMFLIIGDLIDADGDLLFQLTIWDDATGAQVGEPDWLVTPTAGGLLGASNVLRPSAFLPQDGFFYNIWIPFDTPITIPSAFFHVSLDIIAGDAADQFLLGTSSNGQGESDNSNFTWATTLGDIVSYQNDVGLDFDLGMYPMLGPYTPRSVIEEVSYTYVCDTTYVSITDTLLYTPPSDMASIEYQFSDGQVFTFNAPFLPERTVNTYFTAAGPVSVDIITTSLLCGRVDTTTTTLNYNFSSTPDADFTKDLPNPICNTDVVTFTGSPTGMLDYTWDFGDGTIISSGTSNTTTHTFATPGTYYVELTASAIGNSISTPLFSEDFNGSLPGTWTNSALAGANTWTWSASGGGPSGPFAIAEINSTTTANGYMMFDSDNYCSGNQDAAFQTPSIDCSSEAGVLLQFEQFYRKWYEQTIVEVSNDGTNWTQYPINAGLALGSSASTANAETVVVDISATAGNQATVFVRWRFYSPAGAHGGNEGCGYAWMIDDIVIGGASVCSNSEQKLDFVEVIDCSTIPPTADASADVTSGCAPLTVNFTDVTTLGDPATSWLWNFDDGTFSTAQNPPAHIYTLAGTYNVIFQACNAGGCTTETITITVSGIAEDGSFTLSAASACQNGTDITATVTGTTGGTFSSTAGLSINASTGTIDVSASTPGSYTVSYTTSGGACAAIGTQSVTIDANQNAGFNYASATYCTNAPDPTPTITGTTGGTFSSTAGLSLNAATGVIDVSASTAGTYTVTYTTAGPCAAFSTQSVTINNADNASFTMSAASACQSGTDITATVSGTPGGTFSSTVGLVINSSTGTIDVSASTVGTYTVTYTTAGTCSAFSTQVVTINANEDATFTMSAASACQSGTDITANITGTTGGTFSSTAGLSINSSTGTIDVSASTAGAYTVTYTTGGACSALSTESVTINANEDATFTLSAASACQSGTDITANITGTAGGTFSSTVGLVINASSGTIDVSASTPGSYTVTYTTGGTCSALSTQPITINANENAAFTLSAVTVCQSETDVTATISGTTGGTFSSTAGLSINATSGTIDVSASTAGSYTVTYTTGGTCSAFSTQGITINASENASFTLGAASVCQSGTDITASISGTGGGTFSSTAGLNINASSGTIDVSVSTAGTYTVTYTTAGTCSAFSTQSVTINADDDATFSYPSGTYCVSGTDPIATISGTAGGTFSGAGLTINASTGEIDLDATGLGSYTVTYTTGGGCPASSTFGVGITSAPDATFSYTGTPYCANAGTASVTFGAGASGGTFTATPAGLSINAGTGVVTLATSTPGTYVVSNTIAAAGGCASALATSSIEVTAADDATFALSAASACQNGTDVTATISGTTGGTFSSTAGLSINASSGTIDVSASTAGPYMVTYTTGGTCSAFSTQGITINASENASFTLSAASACQSGTDITANITGTTGGTFSSTAGLSITASNGTIDVSASTAGTYVVTYTTSGTCAASSTQSVTITEDDNASFSYSNGTYCLSGTDPIPTISGTSGGTFSGAGLTINATTGEIDLDATGLGSYTVTYTTSGTCPASNTFNIGITSAPDATFSYAGTPYCSDAGTASVTFGAGASGGVFSSTVGLSINAGNGNVNLGASTAGTYTVTNTIAASGGCSAASATSSIVITAVDDASFGYASTSYCQSATDPIPTITGTAGGTFNSSAGLSLNASTGEIDLSTSTVGSYNITYTTAGTCPSSDVVAVTITALDDATFNYSAAAYCASDANPTATVTGVAGGTFSSTAGLVINTTSGQIDLAGSTTGIYTVTYTTSGTCSAMSTQTVTINADDDASFSYSSTSYCQATTDPLPTITGTAGGSFSSMPAGLSINATTGEIDVSASTIASYTVTYTTSGVCSATSDVAVTITSNDDPTFSYSASNYCVGDTDPIAAISGTTGGTFTSTVGLVINATTGEIDLGASTAGTYSVTYTTTGVCSANSSVSVTIDALDDASFSYANATYCPTDSDPTPTVTGVAGGTYSTTAGLSINASTGVIDLSASTPGTYDVTYTTVGTCPNSEIFNITITTPEDASFSYVATSFCSSDANPSATITGTTGGTFTSTAGISINATSGLIDLAASSIGTYTITYTTAGACAASSTQDVTIVDSPIVDDIVDVVACGSYSLPAITGTNLSGSEAYYDATGGSGTSYAAGASITTTTTLFIYDINGLCASEEDFTITIDETPSVSDAGEDQIICDSVMATNLYGNVATVGSGMWTVVNGSGTFEDATDPTTAVTDLSMGNNEFMWMITNGSCTGAMDNVIIEVEKCSIGLVIPSGFTPDGGDNVNATWDIEGIQGYPDCEVIIYNKWGSEIFTSKGYPNAWDGTYKGNALPVGSYYYIIKLNDGSEPYKGTVTIIK